MRRGFPASHAWSKGMCLSGFDNVRRVSSNAFEIAIVLSTFPGVIRPYVHAETSKKKYCAKERPMSRCFIWTAAASNLLWVRLKSDVCVSWITNHLCTCGLLDMMHSLHQSGWERRSSRDHISFDWFMQQECTGNRDFCLWTQRFSVNIVWTNSGNVHLATSTLRPTSWTHGWKNGRLRVEYWIFGGWTM